MGVNQPLKVCVLNYNGKANRLVTALMVEGHQVWNQLDGSDVFLIDTDIPGYTNEQRTVQSDHRRFIRMANKNEIPVVIYPHGADFRWEYDGCIDTEGLEVAMHLVTGEGHKRLHEKLGLGRRVEVCGWFYTPQLPFTPGPSKQRRILFAPRHPWADMVTTPRSVLDNNRDAYNKFCSLPGHKTVRYLGTPAPNGINLDDTGIQFVRGFPDGSFDEILQNDVVVTSETHAYMAVALGKPTVMYGQDDVTHRDFISEVDQPGKYPVRWQEYRDELRYPFDLEDGEAADVVEAACAGGPVLERWKHDWVGDPIDPKNLTRLLRSCLT